MKLKNHLIDDIDYIESPNKSGSLTPKFIVMHYTAGYTAESAIDTLTKKGGKASAHVVVDLDGTITQLVPFNKVAWHAGPSKYLGVSGLNNHSIGIEIVNVGFLKKLSSGKFLDAYGNTVSSTTFDDLVEAKNERVGSDTYFWPTYPEAQLAAVEELTKALIAEYGIEDIVTHEQIDTRGWKTDPGPAFPMKRFLKLLTRDDRNLNEVAPKSSSDVGARFRPTVNNLNVRKGPDTTYGTTRQIGKNDIVTGYKVTREWLRINDDLHRDEWVNMRYLMKV